MEARPIMGLHLVLPLLLNRRLHRHLPFPPPSTRPVPSPQQTRSSQPPPRDPFPLCVPRLRHDLRRNSALHDHLKLRTSQKKNLGFQIGSKRKGHILSFARRRRKCELIFTIPCCCCRDRALFLLGVVRSPPSILAPLFPQEIHAAQEGRSRKQCDCAPSIPIPIPIPLEHYFNGLLVGVWLWKRRRKGLVMKKGWG